MKRESQSESPGNRLVTRRNVLRGIGATVAVALTPSVVSAAKEALFMSEAESNVLAEKRLRQLGEQYEREDRHTLESAIAHNKAKLVKDVHTESGMKISVMQAQTGQNPDLLMLVDDQALNQTVNFLISSMDKVNNKNNQAIDPIRIKSFQDRAAAGKLDNIQMTVIMSGTGGFHTPDGVLIGGGATFNGHPYLDKDPRKTLRPLICFSPDIYYPGEEVMTPTAVTGKFPSDGDTNLAVFKPTAAQSLTAFFAHEASHALLDALGTKVMADLAYNDPAIEHDAGEYEHKAFVLPLNWLHTGAMAGIVEGQSPIPPSFIVPKLL